MIKARTDAHPFGLIIPAKSGVIWEHQCDGISCNQIQQEGIFIPLNKMYFKFEKDKDLNEHCFYEEDKLPFYFEEITLKNIEKSPKEKREKELVHYAFFHEAYEWIIFKGWKNKEDPYGGSLNKFIGKKMLLVYANSD